MRTKIAVILGFIIIAGAGGYWYLSVAPTSSGEQTNMSTINPDITRKQLVHALRQAIEQYVADHGNYPQSLQDLQPQYLVNVSKFSTDPVTGTAFSYQTTDSGLRAICATLSTGTSYCETASK